MLTVSIMLNGEEIARATAENITDLADLSDYWVATHEYGNGRLGIPNKSVGCIIKGHARRQTVWALVEKIARVGQRKRGGGSSIEIVRKIVAKRAEIMRRLAEK